MHISDFDYELPADLIAQTPLKQRDASRMLVLDRGKLYKGLDSMVAWQAELARHYPERRFEVLKVLHPAKDEYHVRVGVTGPFTSDPALRWLFRFKLRGDRIAVLEIA